MRQEFPWKSVIEQIRQTKILRAFIGHSPGYGDHIATIHIIEKLQNAVPELMVELIYENPTVTKIAKLFDLGKALKTNHPLVLNNTTRIISLSYFSQHYEQQVAVPIAFSSTRGLMGNPFNFANAFKCQLFGFFTPFYEPLLKQPRDEGFQLAGDPGLFQYIRQASAVIYPTPSIDSALKFTFKTNFSNPNLAILLKNIVQENFEIFSIYGLDTHFKKINPSLVLLNLVSGIYHAQKKSNALLKPTLLLLLNEFSPNDLIPLSNYLTYKNLTDNLQKTINLKNVLNSFSIRNNVKLFNIHNKTFNQQLEQIQPGQIGIISIGNLPFKIFEALMTNSHYPVLREGASSETLLLNARKPYLYCPPDTDLMNSPTSKLEEYLYSLGKTICGPISNWNETQTPNVIIGQALLDFKNTNSPINLEYEKILSIYHNPKNDLIFTMFSNYFSTLNKTNPQINNTYPELLSTGSIQLEKFIDILKFYNQMRCHERIRSILLLNFDGYLDLTLKECGLNQAISFTRSNLEPPIFAALNDSLIEKLLPHFNQDICQSLLQHESLVQWLDTLEHFGYNNKLFCQISEKCHAEEHPAFKNYSCYPSLLSGVKSGNIARSFLLGGAQGFFKGWESQTPSTSIVPWKKLIEYSFWLFIGYLTNSLMLQSSLLLANIVSKQTNLFRSSENIIFMVSLFLRLYYDATNTLMEYGFSTLGAYSGFIIGKAIGNNKPSLKDNPTQKDLSNHPRPHFA